jgi:hypothetical protein
MDAKDEFAPTRDHYLITEESAPAPFGASLGWLFQLDGDDRRNAFLNAPWVKAVIPIRAKKELKALAWLTKAHVEGTDGLDALYEQGAEEDDDDRPDERFVGKTVGQVLEILAQDVKARNQQAEDSPPDETVYQDGFNPLDGGVEAGKPFPIVDHWIEVMPTDQVVAVEYPPKAPEG